MAIRQFLDFVIISTADSAIFAESRNSPPLWVIDRRLFAGQPSLSTISRTTFRTTIITVALSGARYPGTNLSGDVEITVSVFPGNENEAANQAVTLTTAFGNASFDWAFEPIDTDP